ncbi:hypothetical protein FWG86_00760 [Candidatus Saccharibacteria bacterium]|nr:hypothetical protein [Candidatus Saccharibacteria bacterium]
MRQKASESAKTKAERAEILNRLDLAETSGDKLLFLQLAVEVKSDGVSGEDLKSWLDKSQTLGDFFKKVNDADFRERFYTRLAELAEITRQVLNS